jgi:IS4 transposase
MRHENSVLHSLLQFVPWRTFERLVEEHGTDRSIRRLSTRSQFVALLSGQLAGCDSLRAIETLQKNYTPCLYHVGTQLAHRSTLADANAKRNCAVFAGLFAAILGQMQAGQRRKFRETVRLIDATCLPLSPLFDEVKALNPSVAGTKLHVIYDPQTDAPVYFDISPGNVNDITMAHAIPVEPGATYVFDRGYYHFGWWAKLDAAGCRFVTRLKKNTPTKLLAEHDVAPGSPVRQDRRVRLPERLTSTRRNPLDRDVREIHVLTDSGKTLRLVTNDLDAPAEDIAALYKQRWQIELFFRWVKQNLKIRKFLGVSENAVRIQIAVALIAFMLVRIAFAAQRAVGDLLTFTRLVRLNLHDRRNLRHLYAAKRRALPPSNTQLSLELP